MKIPAPRTLVLAIAVSVLGTACSRPVDANADAARETATAAETASDA